METGEEAPDLFLYGAPGCGKSFVGALLRDAFGYRFEEGDAWLTDDMHASLERGESFTQEQRVRFSGVVAAKIGDVMAEEAARPLRRPIVVSQAMFKRALRRKISDAHPALIFAQVSCDEAVRRSRLEARGTLVGAVLGGKMGRDLEDDAGDPTIRSSEDVEKTLRRLLRTATAWRGTRDAPRSAWPECICGAAVAPMQRALDGAAVDRCPRCPLAPSGDRETVQLPPCWGGELVL